MTDKIKIAALEAKLEVTQRTIAKLKQQEERLFNKIYQIKPKEHLSAFDKACNEGIQKRIIETLRRPHPFL